MANQGEHPVINAGFRATIIAACKEHEKRMWMDDNWRACISIGDQYFVKFGPLDEVESERATQDYIYNHAQRSQSEDTPRIAKVLDHFMDNDGYTKYLVMEHINLRASPPDLEERMQKALMWLSQVPLPSNQTLGPVGGGPIRHKFFKDDEAPFPIPDVATLDQYIQKAYNRLSVVARQITPHFSILGERVMFTQSDLDRSNFGVDEHGRTVLMDFREVGMLPETFVVSTLGELGPTALSSLGVSNNSNGYSMAAIRASLWTAADPEFGMKKILPQS